MLKSQVDEALFFRAFLNVIATSNDPLNGYI